MISLNLSDTIKECAERYRLKPEIVAAVIYQESSGNPLAIRPEPGFYKRYLAGKPLTNYIPVRVPEEWERVGRSYSYGVMQIMGQVGRELGLKNEFLQVLFDPQININLGCKHLRQHLDKFKNLPEEEAYRKALLRYNGGGDPTYPDKIYAHIKSGKHLLFL